MPYHKNVCNNHQKTPDMCIEYFDVIPGLANYVCNRKNKFLPTKKCPYIFLYDFHIYKVQSCYEMFPKLNYSSLFLIL